MLAMKEDLGNPEPAEPSLAETVGASRFRISVFASRVRVMATAYAQPANLAILLADSVCLCFLEPSIKHEQAILFAQAQRHRPRSRCGWHVLAGKTALVDDLDHQLPALL
jgi:hypothetical protein